MQIAIVIEVQNFPQRVEYTVVEEDVTPGDVSHGGRSEEPTVLGPGDEVPPRRAAQTQIVVVRIRVRGYLRIARHSDVQEIEVREQRWLTALAQDHVATRTVTLGRVLEQRDTPLFLLGQLDLAPQKSVVLAVEGIELLRILLEGREGGERRLEGPVPMFENVGAESPLKVRRVMRFLELFHDLGDAGVGHLIGGLQRNAGLLLQRAGTAVPGESTVGVVFVVCVLV